MLEANELENFSLWKEVKIPEKTTSEGAGGEQAWLQDLFAVVHRGGSSSSSSSSSSRKRLGSAEPGLDGPLVYAILSQVAGDHAPAHAESPSTKVTIRAQDVEGHQDILVEVPNYDLNKLGPFKQLSLNGIGRGAFLASRHCCAVFALPPYEPRRGRAVVLATVLNPRDTEGTKGNQGEGGGKEDEKEGKVGRSRARSGSRGRKEKEKDEEDCRNSAASKKAAARRIVKVSWHPLSDAHIGILFSDNVFMLLNLSLKATIEEPEVSLHISFGASGASTPEPVADFCFGASSYLAGGWSQSLLTKPLEVIWLSMTIIFLSQQGRVSFFSPVIPSICVLPKVALDALQASLDRKEKHAKGGRTKASPKPLDQVVGARELDWLKSTLLNPKNHEKANITTAAGELVVLRHKAHLHGHREVFEQNWRAREQVLPDEDPASEYYVRKKARAQLTRYSSIHLMQHMPLAIFAKATASGSVEILVAAAALLPHFVAPPSASPSPTVATRLPRRPIVLEEVIVDTAALQDRVELSGLPTPDRYPGTLMLLARTRKGVSAIAISWTNAMTSGNADILSKLPEPASWMVASPKKGNGREMAGWATFRSARGLSASLMLCMDPICELEPSAQADDLYQRLLFVAGKAQDPMARPNSTNSSDVGAAGGLSRTSSSASLCTPRGPEKSSAAAAAPAAPLKKLPPVPAFGGLPPPPPPAAAAAASSSSAASAAATTTTTGTTAAPTTTTTTTATATKATKPTADLSMPPPSFFSNARPEPINTLQSPVASSSGQARGLSSRKKAMPTQVQLKLREEYARRLSGPIVGLTDDEPFYPPEALTDADAFNKAILTIQKSVAAPLAARQKLLNTLAKTLPGRKAACAKEVEDLSFLSQEVATKCQAVSVEVAEVKRRHEELRQRYERVAAIRNAKIQIRKNQEAQKRVARAASRLQDLKAVQQICSVASEQGVDVDVLLEDQDWVDHFAKQYPNAMAAIFAGAPPATTKEDEVKRSKSKSPTPVPAG